MKEKFNLQNSHYKLRLANTFLKSLRFIARTLSGSEFHCSSLDWNFMELRSLNVFGFGPSVIRWIETLFTNISSCVLNNVLCSPYFEVQRGVRQGDPPSLYLFIIAAEILAIAIQTNTDIHGLQFKKEEFKLVQYADDLTVFVPNNEWAILVFHLLDEF